MLAISTSKDNAVGTFVAEQKQSAKRLLSKIEN